MYTADGLILSCGRTGTTYINSLLNQKIENCVVLQEPPPSRSLFMMTNAAERKIPLGSIAFSAYKKTRNDWYKKAGDKTLLEINPFLIGLSPFLKPENIKHGIVHIVRRPADWIESTLNFGGYKWLSYITPRMPFAHERPSDKKFFEWNRLTVYEKFAWRWRHRNSQIEKVKKSGIPYLLVKYEDIFKEGEFNRDIFIEMINHLGLKNFKPDDFEYPQKKINSSASNPELKKHKVIETKEMIEIYGSLAKKYGY